MIAPILAEQDFLRLCRVYTRSNGKAFTPRDHRDTADWADRMIAGGFLRRVNGRCMFEIIPDAMLAFTEAGHRAALERANAIDQAADRQRTAS